MLTYILLASIFLPKNHEIITRYFKAVIVHSFKSTILIFSIFISYIVGDFIINYIGFKASALQLEFYNIMRYGEGSFLDQGAIQVAIGLLVGVMNVAGGLLSAILIFVLITKGSNLVYQAIIGQSGGADDNMESEAAGKMKSKGV
jgi:hypothetical protein